MDPFGLLEIALHPRRGGPLDLATERMSCQNSSIGDNFCFPKKLAHKGLIVSMSMIDNFSERIAQKPIGLSLRVPVCLSLMLCLPAMYSCGPPIPDGPAPMSLERERQNVERNIKLETDYINSDTTLSDSEKTERIEQVHRSYAAHLKMFEQTKASRDEQYGTE